MWDTQSKKERPIMGDFFQNGVITTLHNLADRPVEELEKDLQGWSNERPMSLIIPALYSEFEGPAMPEIITQLETNSYLTEIIIGLDRADSQQFKMVKEQVRDIPVDVKVIWNDGPVMLDLQSELASEGLAPLERGKGSNVWYAMGYFLASGKGKILALHDADILNYRSEMLARLLYPLANPTFGYAFCKGYYFRTDSDGFNGRVARLLVTPLLRAMKQILGEDDFLTYLDSFRYPLAGEFSMDADLVRGLRIPFDWGLEIGVLSEVYRNYTTSRICQVDIADSYSHKHQIASEDNPSQGLHRMAIDISKSIFRKLAINGEVFSQGFFRTLKATYYRTALDLSDRYQHDAEMNGYPIDRHSEENLIELFSRAITKAGEDYLMHPMEQPFIPSWSVAMSAMPDILHRIQTAVDSENL